MAGRPKNSISDQLKMAKVAITNSIEDLEIKSFVEKYGYNLTRLNEGMDLYNVANAAVAAATAANGAQKQCTDEVARTEKVAMTAYQDLSTIAKAKFKANPGVLSKLGLDRPMPRTTAGIASASYILFDNASSDPEVKAIIAERGYDDAKLAGERAKIEAFDKADDRQEAAKGANQQASAAEVAAMKKLNDWFAEYKKVAKIALREKKNLLEKLGIQVRNRRTPAQRKAASKAAATRAAKSRPA